MAAQRTAEALEALMALDRSPTVPPLVRRYVLYDLRAGVGKTVAAKALGISVPALDQWIRKERIKTVPGRGGRTRIDAVHLAKLTEEVRRLRELGRNGRLVAAAVARLEEDPAFLRGVESGLAAMRAGDVVPFKVPDTFGPDD